MFNTSDAPSDKQNCTLHSGHTTQKDVYNIHAVSLHYLHLCAFCVYLHSIIEHNNVTCVSIRNSAFARHFERETVV